MEKFLRIIAIILITVLCSVGSVFLMIQILKTEYKVETLKLSEWGDYIGGVYGTIFSFLGLIATIIASIFVYNTLQLQRIQIEHQKSSEYFNRVSGLIMKKLDGLNDEITRFRQDIEVEDIHMENIEGWEVFQKLILLENIKATFELNHLRNYPLKINELYNCFQLSKDLRSRICEAYFWFMEMIESENMGFDETGQESLKRMIIQGLRTKIIKQFFEATNKVLALQNEVLDVEIGKFEGIDRKREIQLSLDQANNHLAIKSQQIVINIIKGYMPYF